MNEVTLHSPLGGITTTVALDRLLTRTSTELETLYTTASVPSLLDVHGDLRGRMLAWPSLDRPSSWRSLLGASLRAFASASAFPWLGKSFTRDATKGAGINRVVSDRLRLFRFETFIAKSRAGNFDALQLDYDLPGNPPIIRSIKDEIREIEPGLWLGQAYFHPSRTDAAHSQSKPHDWLWLYFGLARIDG